VIGLQEVDSRSHSGLEEQLAELSTALKMSAVPGYTMLEPLGSYGNALLTSLPVVRVARHDLSVTGREPRGALVVELAVDGQSFHVVVTHLGLNRKERGIQLERLESITDAIEGRLIVMGDFNEWTRRRLKRYRFASASRAVHRSFPSRLPLLPLDAVFVRPRELLLGVELPRLAQWRASDHLPLVARVAMGNRLRPGDTARE
jgi:endonuclease/exonuclease/phosphatase family metal-dependent hydrolase